jgi:hypothetical protein
MLSYSGEANVKQVKQTIEQFYGIQTTLVKATTVLITQLKTFSSTAQ